MELTDYAITVGSQPPVNTKRGLSPLTHGFGDSYPSVDPRRMEIPPAMVYQIRVEKDVMLYAWSPDGEGCLWYDSLEELEEDLGFEDSEVVYFHSDEEFEKYRSTPSFGTYDSKLLY